MSDTGPDNSGVPPVERVRQEVDRWLDAVRTTGERALETLGLTGTNRPSLPAADIVELPCEIIIQIDLPAVSADNVELSIVGNMLTVSASRDCCDFPAEARFHLRERVVGRFLRSIPLPAAVCDDGVKAETRNGMLTVTLRKSVPTTGRSIPVSQGSGS